ncbi:MaoC family dehydratase N-terminal domain-containing protein [Pseudomonas fluorescens]|uniref:FAS1-like dehydratase domain-containing protein n=1 Tax=Pseudomonas fluorescens TaxID=294 RepID=UPI002ACADB2A|nr:MaoC family dehydratase N-terminal domain-containing protein [Pseudomonas fluorescens]MDZ5431940.1 MaoC family dehydratase N-terminal domain-containing protein [Pseudomonas fluorescens]
MKSVDAESLRAWIGRTKQDTDVITSRLVQAYRATLAPCVSPTDEVAPGLHWCLAPPIESMHDLGADGHPNKGSFLPPVPLPRRMWAGGEIEFRWPLHVGDVVTRVSTISDIQVKEGRTGVLCFVSVEHAYRCRGELAIRERQDIVYRDEPQQAAAPVTVVPLTEARRQSDIELTLETPQALLFRYSALTFNAHRIHYDLPYATEIEGYAGLVVHGPLQASFLLNLATLHKGRVPRHFSYRGQVPLLAGQGVTVAGKESGDGAFECWTQGTDLQLNMTARATW